MASCKDCIHDRVCPHLKDSDAGKCGAFKNKANFVELPYPTGTTVFVINGGRIVEMLFDVYVYGTFDDDEIHLTYEEAENALAKMDGRNDK